MSWVRASNGLVPPNATQVGNEADGTPLYLARAHYQGGVHIGKVRTAFGAANIPYGGKEVKVADYEIYVGPAIWAAASGGKLPDGAVKYGEESNGEPLFAARAHIHGGIHPGKVRLAFGAANIPYGGKEEKATPDEVLIVRP
jgi:hypothetical protein